MEQALSKLSQKPVMAVYLDAELRVVAVENVQNVDRAILPAAMLDKRPNLYGRRVVMFHAAPGISYTKICCAHGQCWPCSISEYVILKLIEFFRQLFSFGKKRAL
jgi:hypothetical protein